jgi:transcriptional regulator with XRE-family HTH domain
VPFDVQSGERLATERERLGLSQQALSDATGVARNMLSRYERGIAEPGASALMALAGSGVDVLFVLTGQRTPQSAQALSPEDTALLDNYHAATDEDRAVARRVLSLVAKQTQKRA